MEAPIAPCYQLNRGNQDNPPRAVVAVDTEKQLAVGKPSLRKRKLAGASRPCPGSGNAKALNRGNYRRAVLWRLFGGDAKNRKFIAQRRVIGAQIRLGQNHDMDLELRLLSSRDQWSRFQRNVAVRTPKPFRKLWASNVIACREKGKIWLSSMFRTPRV